jgi:hypothetical protein
MARTGIAHLPLHGGKAPAWLFKRMTKLARELAVLMVQEFGTKVVLERFSDPYWFQGVGCVLEFDWHSSGVTTTVCGAFQEGIKGLEDDLGFYIAGGKGRRSRQTPAMIEEFASRAGLPSSQGESLVYASRMSAKVDSAAVQDGYQIYQHSFFFDRQANWAVVQQGMNEETRYARRYHWLSDSFTDFVEEPHKAIAAVRREDAVLNLVARGSRATRERSVVLTQQDLRSEVARLKVLAMPEHHPVTKFDFDVKRLQRIMSVIREHQPEDFEQLLGLPGVGSKTLRALALISELVYGTPLSWQDPARYSFAHGGKDGFPYPVDRPLYDRSIQILKIMVDKMKLDHSDKVSKMRQLERMFGT